MKNRMSILQGFQCRWPTVSWRETATAAATERVQGEIRPPWEVEIQDRKDTGLSFLVRNQALRVKLFLGDWVLKCWF